MKYTFIEDKMISLGILFDQIPEKIIDSKIEHKKIYKTLYEISKELLLLFDVLKEKSKKIENDVKKSYIQTKLSTFQSIPDSDSIEDVDHLSYLIEDSIGILKKNLSEIHRIENKIIYN